MYKKKTSIIIPTKDRNEYLKQCLQSMEDYGYHRRSDVEVIVVDNNSFSRKIPNICADYRAKYISEPQRGRSAALNTGIRYSSGKYLVFIDDDVELCSEDWIDKLISTIEGDPEVGYVSGRVCAYETKANTQRIWEEKGGLSKGNIRRVFDEKFLSALRWRAIPVRLMAAGANSLIPAQIIDKVGGYSELFGIGSGNVPHGESLEICYRIVTAGYVAIYNPNAVILHHHPSQHHELVKKHFIYGIGDTAVHFHFFIENHDFRSLLEAIFVRNVQIVRRLLKSLIGRYPLTPDILVVQILGNLLGPLLYLISKIRTRMTKI